MAEHKVKEQLSDLINLGSNSFIVLGSGSFNSMLNNELDPENFNNDFVTVNSGDSLDSFKKLEEKKNANVENESISKNLCDISLQEKLNQLLKENCHLKDTLNQNNLAMRTQLSTFCMWQQEVLKTHETHMQKFSETKDLVVRLRAENLELKDQLNVLSNSICTDSSQNLKLQMNNSLGSKECLKCIEKEQENGKIQNLYQSEIKKNESLVMEKCELQKIIEESKENLVKCNNSLVGLKKINDSLKQKIMEQSKSFTENFSSGLLPNCEARIQINNLLKELEKEKAKVSNLNEELKKYKSQNNKSIDKIPTEELSEYISELDNLDESFKKQSQRINGLSSWIHLSEENLLKSNILVQNSGDKLASEAIKDSHLSSDRIDLKTKDIFQNKGEQVSESLQVNKSFENKSDCIEVESTLNELKDCIENLKEEIKKKDEIIKGKDDELNILRNLVKKLNLECEEIAILKLQAELYRSDFNDERAAREKLAGEKEELAEEIRILKSKAKEEDLMYSESSEQDSISENQSMASKGKKKKKKSFICPKCMFSFSELKTCQEHIEECINIHFYP